MAKGDFHDFGDTARYSDLFNLPHPTSAKHPRMSAEARAAQFSPFAALTGYGDAVEETARWTDTQAGLGEAETAALDQKLRLLQELGGTAGEISVCYFRPDERKAGGAYVTATGRVKKIDLYAKALVLESGAAISIGRIYELRGECFAALSKP